MFLYKMHVDYISLMIPYADHGYLRLVYFYYYLNMINRACTIFNSFLSLPSFLPLRKNVLCVDDTFSII